MIFAGFETVATAPGHPEGHDLNLSSDCIQGTAPITALALDPEQTAPSEDGRINPTTEAADSAALEPHTDLTSCDVYVTGTSDLSPAISSEPCASADAELDQLSIFEFSAADIFQHSPFGDVLSSLKSLSLLENSRSNYVRLEWEVDNEEFCIPPTTHFIATVDDLTDMLDYDSEDIDDMDDDAREEQEPPLSRPICDPIQKELEGSTKDRPAY